MFTTSDLETFLKKHEGEWWTPYEIGKEKWADIRTVKNVIRRLDTMTNKSWVLDIAERGDRLYCVRMVMDIEISRKRIRVPKSSKKQPKLHNFKNYPPPG